MKIKLLMISFVLLPFTINSQDCVLDSDCGWPNYCVSSIGFCNISEDNPGFCVDLADYDCAAIWQPVCGCDGNIYSNDCEANYQNFMGIAHLGECENPLQEIGDECTHWSGESGYLNCLLDCIPAEYFTNWLGDGICDYEFVEFDCPEFGFDCGDCNPDWDGTDPLGFCEEECSIPGDVNNDGFVNILDIVGSICILIYPNDCGTECSCDINGDEMCNVLDIVILVNIILEE